jgi:DNA invertase Pin-like site-specific DNA recombinase
MGVAVKTKTRKTGSGDEISLRLRPCLSAPARFVGCCLAIFHGAIFDSCGIMRDVVISIMGTPAQQERNGIWDRTKAGLQRARRAGKRAAVMLFEVDVKAARKMGAEGLSVGGIAAMLGISVNTLQRAVQDDLPKSNEKTG